MAKNLHAAKKAKNDEFYTQLTDIEQEMKHYRKHFKDKTVFLNCDDPETSMFWKFFELNFDFLGLKRLISTHYDRTEPTYMLEMTLEEGGDLNGDGIHDHHDIIKTPLKQNGDFRSDECIELLKQADIVVSNPPFSLFREYMEQLIEHDKKFIIIGNMNACTYKEIFPLIADNKVWIGANEKGGTRKGNSLLFAVPDDYEAKSLIEQDGKKLAQVSAWWYTNLDFTKRHDEMTLYKKYDPETYPKYDNYDAIECGKSPNVPYDYEESWGIPLDAEIDEDKWEKLYDGKWEDGETYQWMIPAAGTELYDKFQAKEDGYVDEITAELSRQISQRNHRSSNPVPQRILQFGTVCDMGSDGKRRCGILSRDMESGKQSIATPDKREEDIQASVHYRNGMIGVPISFLNEFYSPEQFEIIGSFNNSNIEHKQAEYYVLSCDTPVIINGTEKLWNGPVINKNTLYKRMVIRQKN